METSPIGSRLAARGNSSMHCLRRQRRGRRRPEPKMDPTGKKPTKPTKPTAPSWLGRRINAQKGEWGLRVLRAVIGAPTMRADGTLLVEPGYDPVSGLFLLPGIDRPVVPETPNLADLKAAAERLWVPFAEFP